MRSRRRRGPCHTSQRTPPGLRFSWGNFLFDGIVESVDNFGTTGKKPDNQPLLDFLDKVVTPYAEKKIGSRKAFCDAFGIGESTLSGWSKEGRIPRSARSRCRRSR